MALSNDKRKITAANNPVWSDEITAVIDSETEMVNGFNNIHQELLNRSKSNKVLTDGKLGKLEKAVDSEKLDGFDSTHYAKQTDLTSVSSSLSTSINTVKNELDTKKLGRTEKAVDSDKLDGNDSTFYAKKTELDNINNLLNSSKLGKTEKAVDSDKLDGLDSSAFLRVNGKAVDSDKIDGLQGAQLLRSDVDDSYTGKLISNTRQGGVYGTYDSTKIDTIWSMGSGYKIDASGANFGNLYGAAYKHTNNPTGGTMAGGHQFIWTQNGNPCVALGNNLWTSGTVYEGGQSLSSRYLGKSQKAVDSDKLDGLNSTDFLRVNGKAVSSSVADRVVNLNYNRIELINILHPVGSIIQNATDGFNPNTLYSGTSWVEIKGRVLVGKDTTQGEFNIIGKKGGAKTHALSIAELASHTHSANHNHSGSSSSSGVATPSLYMASGSSGQTSGSVKGIIEGSGTRGSYSTSYISGSGSHTHSVTINTASINTGSCGVGAAHNNLQPYEVIRIWKRTA